MDLGGLGDVVEMDELVVDVGRELKLLWWMMDEKSRKCAEWVVAGVIKPSQRGARCVINRCTGQTQASR